MARRPARKIEEQFTLVTTITPNGEVYQTNECIISDVSANYVPLVSRNESDRLMVTDLKFCRGRSQSPTGFYQGRGVETRWTATKLGGHYTPGKGFHTHERYSLHTRRVD